MSGADAPTRDGGPPGGDRSGRPGLDLASAVDEPEDPTRITVYPADADAAAVRTTWLTVAVEVAVPLDAMQ
ncbi:MAG: hypothetical protein V5A23_02185 [Halobacteriales archaeon]